jgi:hypothetical protein
LLPPGVAVPEDMGELASIAEGVDTSADPSPAKIAVEEEDEEEEEEEEVGDMICAGAPL